MKRLDFLQDAFDGKVVPTAKNVAELTGSDEKSVEESVKADLSKYLLDQDFFKKYEEKLAPDQREKLQELEKLFNKN